MTTRNESDWAGLIWATTGLLIAAVILLAVVK